ncbi:transposase [Candidatus Parcubacteria bacterium]|nr:transposase [Candidatus Parcubacteria bacterium]
MDCTSAIIDGTFIKRRKGIIVVMDAERHTLLYGAYNVSEKPRDLHTFFRTLAQRGLSLKYATIDGNPALSIALQQQWPEVILQRCLVHIQRQGLSWCRRNPKRTDAKHLRELFLAVTSVDTVAKRDMFVDHVITWEQRYGARIAGTPDHGYVFSDLKRARSMLLAALPNMFHYLFHPSIARSTNALEGYFARLKQRYRQHRGLAQRHRYAYFQWYLALCKR